MGDLELEPGEQITMLVRRHWIVIAGPIVSAAFGALLPLAFLFGITIAAQYYPTLTPIVTAATVYARPLRFALAVWWLFLWLGLFTTITQYFLTVWIITTTRIIDIHQYGFFSRKVSSFLLSRVQDVTSEIRGFIPTLFSFGTLTVETAGRNERFTMTAIGHPEQLRDLILAEITDLNQTRPAPPQNL